MKKIILALSVSLNVFLSDAQTLVAKYDFSGNTNDASGNAYLGALVNSASYTTDRYGNANSAVACGTGDYVSTNCPGVSGGNARTISFWAKINPGQAGGGAFNYGGGPLGGDWNLVLATGAGEGAYLDISDAAGTQGLNIDDGMWHHYTQVYDPVIDVSLYGTKLFRDGNKINNLMGPYNYGGHAVNTYATTPVTIGGGEMEIDDVKIWDYAYADTQVDSLFRVEAAPVSNLLGNWTFNGNANDLSPGNNHGTLNGTAPTIDRFGNSLKAYLFNGSTDFIDCGPSINVAGQSFSFSFWSSRATTSPVFSAVVSQGTATTDDGLHIGFTGANGPQEACFDFYNDSYNTNIPEAASTNQWIHWAYTYDYTTLTAKLYCNGQSIGSGLMAGQLTALGNFYLGKAFGTNFFDGALDEVKLYATELNATQIDSIYKMESPPPCFFTSVPFSTDITCFGLTDGSASLIPASGTGPYSYLWNPGGLTTDTITGLSAGTYTCDATDAFGCVSQQIISINEPAAITFFGGANDVTCFGACNGSVFVGISGGTGSATYFWNPGGYTTDNPTGLCPATYTVTATDANGCTGNDMYTVNEPPMFSMSPTSTDITCPGLTDGTMDATAAGGIPPYSYSWSPVPFNGPSVTGVEAGTYSVTAFDLNSCVAVATITVNAPAPIALNLSAVSSSCGAALGSASSAVTGGTAPYMYYWSTASSAANISSLTAGQYFLQVTDANNCYASDVIIVNDANGPSLSVTSVTPVTCAGNANGAIDISVSGGVLPYSIVWSNNEVTEDLSGLDGGSYDVVVTDNNGCLATQTINVPEPDTLMLTTSNVSAGCGLSDGSADVTPTGGTVPYSYLWDANAGNATSSSVSALASGFYKVTVTDNNSCVDSVVIAISDFGGPTVIIDSIQNAGCVLNGGNGAIYTSSYGFGPYAYNWSNGAVTDDVMSLGIGSFAITVTDSATGCKTSVSQYISGERPGTAEICVLTVDTATNHNVIVWNDTVQGIALYRIYRESSVAGIYNIIATIQAGTTNTFVDTIANPDNKPWRYEIKTTDSCGRTSVFSLAHKTIHLEVTPGATAGFDISWDQYQGSGVYFTHYRILRFLPSTGWVVIDSVPAAGPLFYNDQSSPLPLDTNYYFIEINSDAGCNAALRTDPNGPEVLAAITKSRSNIQNNKLNSTGFPEEENAIVSIFPNPAKNNFRISYSKELNGKRKEIRLKNVLGQILYSAMSAGENKEDLVNVNGLANGVYFVEVTSGAKRFVKKLVIEE
jgi:hypothetical protein